MVDKMEGVISGAVPGILDPSKYPVPIETIYVNNLEEWVKPETMKQALTLVFKHYGPILDIIVKKSLKRKGQAFIVFDSEKSVLGAVEEMTGFELYGKALKVAKARTHSDETVIRKAPAMFEEHKRKRLMLKDFKRAEEDSKALANPAAAADKPRAVKTGAALIPDEYVRPNKTLFLQNVPKEVDEEALTAIFERFEGFKEVRAVSVRAVAFAEFENEQFAITAKEATANMPIGPEGKQMKVSYQRQQVPEPELNPVATNTYTGGFNPGGFNHGGFNHGGFNHGGFNHGGFNPGGFNPTDHYQYEHNARRASKNDDSRYYKPPKRDGPRSYPY